MKIILAQIYFQEEKDSGGNLFGCFLGEEVVSDPIYSKEMAYKILEGISKILTLSPKEINSGRLVLKIQACLNLQVNWN